MNTLFPIGLVLLLLGSGTAVLAQESCREHLRQHRAGGDLLQKETDRYQLLVEEALTYRFETIAIGRALKAKMADDQPLTGRDLEQLNAGTVAHLQLRGRLFEMAELHECWLTLDSDALEKAGITPLEQLQGVMISLSAALVLYDNYLLAISLFEEDDKLRRIINLSDSGYNLSQAELAKVTLSYNSVHNRRRVRGAIYFYEKQGKRYREAIEKNPATRYLNLLIQQSPSYDMTKSYSPFSLLGRKLDFFGAVTGDTLHRLTSEGVNIFSMLFGNAVGLVESRHGKLYDRKDTQQTLSGELRAGDILLEKTPFRLTDSLIPGHWGHAAIWIGTEEELKALGIWNHGVVRPYHSAIRDGLLIVEALRSGVQLSSLEAFSNVDDLAVLRPEATRTGRADTLLRALRQVGKAYDFNFDVETTDRIVCSELIYLTYTDIEWPTDKTLGRVTISPDNIARKAVGGGPLEIVALYHDGRPMGDDPASGMLALLKP